uniref:hypothetical protein n=1 Tax=uncultured Dysgonomonas sp. TaxID=206096 RepID=UPI00260BC7A9|nr:hypothetical protein [uncultured Dysgonomonas sp.]
MKQHYLSKAIVLLLCSFLITACNNEDEPTIKPSVRSIEMEGEGGETDISLNTEDIKIAHVINKDGNIDIFGEVYTADGKISKNTKLELTGLGKVESIWKDKGFCIVRNTASQLKVIVEENNTGQDFSFAIILQSGNEITEITILQKKSQGYTFDNIEYSIQKDDSDSIYTTKGSRSYTFDISSPMEISTYPFLNLNKQSFFESNDKSAFTWYDTNRVEVKVPSGIYKNEIYYNGDKSRYSYGTDTRPSQLEEIETKISIPNGKSHFYFEIQYRKRKVSYLLTLINNRTKNKKNIEGKWVEIVPTGSYKIIEEKTD